MTKQEKIQIAEIKNHLESIIILCVEGGEFGSRAALASWILKDAKNGLKKCKELLNGIS